MGLVEGFILLKYFTMPISNLVSTKPIEVFFQMDSARLFSGNYLFSFKSRQTEFKQ